MAAKPEKTTEKTQKGVVVKGGKVYVKDIPAKDKKKK